MQRQSLGSPSSKIQPSAVAAADCDEEEIKAEKRARCGLRADKSIHLIPLLTLLCFLVLYLFSHRPSPQDLEAIGSGGASRLLRDPKAISAGAGRASAARGNRGLKAALVAAGGRRRGGGGSLPSRKLGAAARRAVRG